MPRIKAARIVVHHLRIKPFSSEATSDGEKRVMFCTVAEGGGGGKKRRCKRVTNENGRNFQQETTLVSNASPNL